MLERLVKEYVQQDDVAADIWDGKRYAQLWRDDVVKKFSQATTELEADYGITTGSGRDVVARTELRKFMASVVIAYLGDDSVQDANHQDTAYVWGSCFLRGLLHMQRGRDVW